MTDVIFDLMVGIIGLWYFGFEVLNTNKRINKFWMSVIYIGFVLSILTICWSLVRFLSWLLL